MGVININIQHITNNPIIDFGSMVIIHNQSNGLCFIVFGTMQDFLQCISDNFFPTIEWFYQRTSCVVGNDNVLLYMLVTLYLPILVQYPSDTCCIRWFTCFLLQIRSPPSAIVRCRTRGARTKGGGSHGWLRIVCVFAREFIL